MLCISLTSTINNMLIRLNNRITASRIYIHVEDIPQFPNRLVFKTSGVRIGELLALINASDCNEDWLTTELASLATGQRELYVVVPFVLRVGEEPHANFYESERLTRTGFDFQAEGPVLYIRGNLVPTICTACPRQAELRGRRCPDFEETRLACLNTALFAQQSAEAYYLNERGELIYVAATDSGRPTQVEDSQADTQPRAEA